MTPFQQAFADARAAGKKEFEFGGKPYNTRLKGEKAGASAKASGERKAPPARTAKATVSQTVRPTGTTTTKTVATKPATSGAVPTIMARPKLDAAARMLDRNLRGGGTPKVAVAKVATGPKVTTMAALKANKKDFSRAGVEARKMATMTGPKVARKK